MRGSWCIFSSAASRNSRLGPDLPSEDDLLALLGGHGAMEVGALSSGDLVLPGFDDLQAALLLEQRRAGLGPLAIGLHLFGGHGNDEAADIHGSGSFPMELEPIAAGCVRLVNRPQS